MLHALSVAGRTAPPRSSERDAVNLRERLPEFAFDRPVSVLMLFVAMLVIGMLAWVALAMSFRRAWEQTLGTRVCGGMVVACDFGGAYLARRNVGCFLCGRRARGIVFNFRSLNRLVF